jgi:aspartate oxidase
VAASEPGRATARRATIRGANRAASLALLECVVIAIDVDKNFSLDEGRAQIRRFMAVRNRRKKRLRSFRILPE